MAASGKKLLPAALTPKEKEKVSGPGESLALKKGKSTRRHLDLEVSGAGEGDAQPANNTSRSNGSSALDKKVSEFANAQAKSMSKLRVGVSARELRPLVRKGAKLTFTTAGKKSRIRGAAKDSAKTGKTPKSSKNKVEDDDDNFAPAEQILESKTVQDAAAAKAANDAKVATTVRERMEKGKFHVHLIQLGSSYRIAFSESFLNLVSQFDFDVNLYIMRKRPAAQMTGIEEDAEFGRMNKADAKVVSLGKLPPCTFNPNNVEDDEAFDHEAVVSHDFFFGDTCFEFDSEFPTMVSSPLEWTGVALVKCAETKPVSLYPAVLFYAKLAVIHEKKKTAKKKADAVKEAENIQEKMRSATTWEPGLGLRTIRRLLRSKLRYFDRNGSNTIDFEEFKAAMENLGLFLTETRLQKLFQACDLDRSGTVELDELPLALHINDQLRVRTRMTPRDAFELFDYDGSGSINEQEFFEVVNLLPVASMTRERAGKVFARHDTDNSGEIEYDEFREIWLSSLCDITSELTVRIKDAQLLEIEKMRAGIAPGGSSSSNIEQDEASAAEADVDAGAGGADQISDAAKAKATKGADGAASAAGAAGAEEKDIQTGEPKVAAEKPSCEKAAPEIDAQKLEASITKLKAKHARQLQWELRRTRGKKIKRLRELVLEEERAEAAEFEAAREKAYHDAHALRIEVDTKKRQQKLQRRREEIAAKVAVSKAERELRRQKQLELSQRRRAESREKALRAQLNKEIRYREEKERADRRAERELRLQQEKEARARRGDDRLDMPNQGLRAVPPTLYKGHEAQTRLGHLVSIDLSHNKLESLPKQGLFFWCGYVRKLDVSNNRLTSLPEEVEALESIEIFTAVHNRLRALPPQLGALPKLISLNVAENEIEELSDSFCVLPCVRNLQLYKNVIKRLPAGLGNLRTLRRLDVSLNALRELPDEICELESLQSLDVSWNRLQKLPTAIGKLSSLETLILSGNELRRLPDSLQTLHALQVLQLGRNDLIEVPATVEGLISLLRLDVSRNRIVRIPRELGKVRTLQHLDISGNLIRLLPPELGRLRGLVVFEAYSNLIERIPEELAALSSLEELNLCHNKLAGRLPMAVGALRQLRMLNLAENEIEILPSSLGALVNLEVFNMNGNKLTVLPATVACWNVKTLLLSRNRVKSLPVTFGNLCDSLDLLDLSSNALEFVPAELTSLRTLRHLDLHHNRLRAVPPPIAKIVPQLETFRVTHNPLSELPPKFANEVAAGGPRSDLIWSGYSDGQVAEWAMEVQDVLDVCRACMDLDRVMAPNSDPNRLSFWEFSCAVKERLQEEDKWREQLMPHVNSYFFRTKALGEVPRLDAIAVTEVTSRADAIAKREIERQRVAAEAKEQHEERELRLREVYSVSRPDFLQAETELKRNAARIRDEKEVLRKKEIESTRPIHERQEKVYIETKRQREAARKAQLEEWLGHFRAQHDDYIQELIASEATRESPSNNNNNNNHNNNHHNNNNQTS
ncbi:Leucine-rich repeat-containing protein 1 [Hondaea fermentalgiana]|uniref:Leucine-rich repeat-containing protein 1 n=1 Tax=Hondaea fermentalgiana TaxID=2315210 RepID=A0A2R5GPP8_9STRA|nr:Leucine-rich repeat-containing protein 1 [Hondaea fermentalgiana]|eukprot:GBG29854.1 Leucine-rich repeat-containing protein 1 [Hondaea fermentalgiana]